MHRATVEKIAQDEAITKDQRGLLNASLKSSRLSPARLSFLADQLLKTRNGGGWFVVSVVVAAACLFAAFYLTVFGFSELENEGLWLDNSKGASLLLAAICIGGLGFVAIEAFTIWLAIRIATERSAEYEIKLGLQPDDVRGWGQRLLDLLPAGQKRKDVEAE